MTRDSDELLPALAYRIADSETRCLRDLTIYDARKLVERNEVTFQQRARKIDAHLLSVAQALLGLEP